ncbi:MAG: hypothetical protein ACL93V_01565 [Candidatus Electrothrix sp. YB6]
MAPDKKIISGIPKIFSAITILSTIGLFFLTRGHFCRKSDITNCVVVEKESQFTGKWLKHSQAIMHTHLPTDACRAQDQKIDAGDGPKEGKVRWAECTYGPDCNEKGMF